MDIGNLIATCRTQQASTITADIAQDIEKAVLSGQTDDFNAEHAPLSLDLNKDSDFYRLNFRRDTSTITIPIKFKDLIGQSDYASLNPVSPEYTVKP